MKVHQVLSMNGGEGESSYASNSSIQREVMIKSKPVIEESIKELYFRFSSYFECFRMADFGCSSGPNTLLLFWEIMDIIDKTCNNQLNCKALEFQVFLNDLPRNDFNTIFKSLPSFYENLKRDKGSDFGPCFIAGMPGNCYGRLFPKGFLHFAHSSYSLQWRSQVPEGLVTETGDSLNKGNIYLAKTSPPGVFKAYLDLFEKDFTLFLRSRSEEMIPGGYMVLCMIGSDRKADSSTNHGCAIWELLGITLNDMVCEGLIEEEKLNWFNLPYYAPAAEEVKHVIQREGSFDIKQFEMFEVDWDANKGNGIESLKLDKRERGKYVAMSIRVVAESILSSHFGSTIMDTVFERFAMKIVEYLEVEKGEYTNMVISMIKG